MCLFALKTNYYYSFFFFFFEKKNTRKGKMQHFELLNFRADLRVGEPGPLVACSLGLHSLRSDLMCV